MQLSYLHLPNNHFIKLLQYVTMEDDEQNMKAKHQSWLDESYYTELWDSKFLFGFQNSK